MAVAVTIGFEQPIYNTAEPSTSFTTLEVCLEVTSGSVGRELVIIPNFVPVTATRKYLTQVTY